MQPNPYQPPRAEAAIPKVAKREGGTQLLFATGVAAMLGALFLQNVTLTRNYYREVLVIALGLAIVADACLAAVVWFGPSRLRLLALAAMVPTLLILADFLRRAPHTF